MPPIGAQLELPWVFPANFTVARGLLRPGRAYADAVKLFEPYDHIRDPQPEVRVDLLRLIAEVMRRQDRKSTRLNSSHTVISYAVFCLKKKKNMKDYE